MTDPTARSSIERLASWPGWITGLTLGFVIACLVVLAAAPTWLNRRLADMRRLSNATTERAAHLSTELRYALAEEVTSHQEYRFSHASRDLADYHSARIRTDSILGQLAVIAPAVDSIAARFFTQAARLIRAWHVPQDARADGSMSEAQFVATIPTLGALRDSAIANESAFDSHVAVVENDHQRAAEAMIDRQQVLAVVLGIVAILAGVLVAWLARRERLLAHAITAAFDREQRLRAQSEQRRQDLERVTESKTRLMRAFTHDVKNPLGAADGFLSLMQEDVHGPLTSKQRDTVARVRRSLRTALTLVTDLLELARAESGQLTLRFETVDVCALVNDIAGEFRGQAEAKGLQLRAASVGDVPRVTTDKTRLHEVLGNLVTNAVKYTERGSVEIRTSVRDETAIQIDVADTGRGIAADKVDLLFKEFVRLDPAAAEGTGLGLTSTRRIADAMGATILVRSEPGRGSVFSVRLPIHKSS